jgi:hypothetical protein
LVVRIVELDFLLSMESLLANYVLVSLVAPPTKAEGSPVGSIAVPGLIEFAVNVSIQARMRQKAAVQTSVVR